MWAVEALLYKRCPSLPLARPTSHVFPPRPGTHAWRGNHIDATLKSCRVCGNGGRRRCWGGGIPPPPPPNHSNLSALQHVKYLLPCTDTTPRATWTTVCLLVKHVKMMVTVAAAIMSSNLRATIASRKKKKKGWAIHGLIWKGFMPVRSCSTCFCVPLLCAHPQDERLEVADWQPFLEIKSIGTFHRVLLTQI